MDGKQTVVTTKYLTPDRSTDSSGEIIRFLRMATLYRTLADGARTESGRKAYMAMAADYEDFAKLAEETLISAKAWQS